MNRLALLTVVLVGCAVEMDETGPQLLVPDMVAVDWDSSLDGVDDGLVALVPVDVMVYDSQSGDPLESVDIELFGAAPDTLLVGVEDVFAAQAVDDLYSWDDPGLMWDAWRDRYVSLSEGVPTERLVVSTDATGLARVYVVVDRFRDRSASAVIVRSEDLEQTIFLRPL